MKSVNDAPVGLEVAASDTPLVPVNYKNDGFTVQSLASKNLIKYWRLQNYEINQHTSLFLEGCNTLSTGCSFIRQ